MSQPIILINMLIVYSSSSFRSYSSSSVLFVAIRKRGKSYCIFHSLPHIVHPNLSKSGVVEGIVYVVVVCYKVNIYLTSKQIAEKFEGGVMIEEGKRKGDSEKRY